MSAKGRTGRCSVVVLGGGGGASGAGSAVM